MKDIEQVVAGCHCSVCGESCVPDDPIAAAPVVRKARITEPLRADESRQEQADNAIYNRGWNDCRAAMLASSPAAPGIDLGFLEHHVRWIRDITVLSLRDLGQPMLTRINRFADEALKVIEQAKTDASPKGGSTDPRQLPCLPFAVFDEFGVGADDRVADYGRACATAAMQPTRAEVKP